MYTVIYNEKICLLTGHRSCPELPNIHDGLLLPHDRYIGSVAQYRCLPGYRFEEGGTIRTLICRYGGKWSSEPGHCQGMVRSSQREEPLLDHFLTPI